MDHPLPKHCIRNRMKLEHMREQRRDLIAKLRAHINARVDTLNQELTLCSLSSLSLTEEPKKTLSAPEDDLEHLLAGIRERTGLMREDASVGGSGEDEDVMEE